MQLTELTAANGDIRAIELSVIGNSSSAPLACTLSATAQQDRLGQWAPAFQQVEHRTSVVDGVALRFPRDRELSETLTKLIYAELECCAFFVFDLAFDAAGMTLTVRAPGHGLDVVEQMFGRP